MTFREKNRKYYEPAAQSLMIFGLIALCQPWIEPLHRYGVTITIVGLIAFMVTSHIGPEPEAEEEEEDELI
ncbi:hypothetical protein [Chachezhania antarctica]|uniref:hypothetical protein n=1 Tax=Chachezhania antarctica TaxID=2340860 RepID=UPI000EAC3302|nr:hypothetical protein [Chachezhania antarctica]|tara:strand:+ start:12190 stop:12402 length:213 start_codon:yes stop_codon:yes gene_type:complete